MTIETDIDELKAESRATIEVLNTLLFVCLKNVNNPVKFLEDFRVASQEDYKSRAKVAQEILLSGRGDIYAQVEDLNDAYKRISDEMVEKISIGD
ncbi:hypothetical protein [Gluconobacter oxydans]|uniref:hypothetical protein n=1 Tax=Gluconobacter oxydans TaxID=442 RepID=UPI0039ECCC78